MKLPFDEISNLARERIGESPFTQTSFSKAELQKDLEDDIEDLLIMSYALGWGLFGEEIGVDTPFSSKGVQKALETKINGKTYKEYLIPHIEDEDVEGIYRVIDTEVHRMYATGQDDNAHASGMTKKTWRTMEDLKVRDSHTMLDKVTVGLNEKFYTTDGDSAMYPGGFATAENNANCRCILTYSK